MKTALKYSAALETSEHVRAKVRALKEVPGIKVTEELGTALASLPDGTMIFQAIQKHAGGP